MSGFDADLNIGRNNAQQSDGFSLSMFAQPTVVIAHVAFRTAALTYYLFAGVFSDSIIIHFIVILILLSMDFWTVKNVTGRLLVGLRWWNFVDAEGNNHWKFESAKDQSRFSAMDRRAFWFALILAPLCWVFFIPVTFFTGKWNWTIIAFLGFSMTSANLWGYLRCRWADTNQLTNYVSRWAFLSMLRRNRQDAAQATMQENI